MHRMNKAKEAKRRARKILGNTPTAKIVPDRRSKLLKKAERKDERNQTATD